MAGKEVMLSSEMNDLLTQVARNRGVSKEDALRTALALLDVSEQQRILGHSLGVVKQDDEGGFTVVALLK